MDNHAGNSNINDLKWLGGLIDSDGSIGITKNRRKNNNFVYTPSIVITNSNAIILEKTCNILNHYKINHHVKANSRCKNICIIRPTIIDKFIKLMFDKILVKKNELRLLHQFCLSRIDSVTVNKCNWKANYTKYDLRIFDALRELNINHYGECKEYSILDNILDIQILENFSLHWLAGFIDGDGCLTINKIKRKDGSYQYQPLVDVVTGSLIAKNLLVFYLDRYNINYYLKKSLPGVNHKHNCRNKKFEFMIRANEDCINIIKLINNKIFGKRLRANLLLEFCNSRLINKGNKYTENELLLYDSIKKDIRDSSTTISKTST